MQTDVYTYTGLSLVQPQVKLNQRQIIHPLETYEVSMQLLNENNS